MKTTHGKRIGALLAIVAALACASGLGADEPAPGGNLLENPGFETVDAKSLAAENGRDVALTITY